MDWGPGAKPGFYFGEGQGSVIEEFSKGFRMDSGTTAPTPNCATSGAWGSRNLAKINEIPVTYSAAYDSEVFRVGLAQISRLNLDASRAVDCLDIDEYDCRL